MMKRWISLALSLLMLLTLAPTALAAETKPVPPAWVKAEEYAVFEGGQHLYRRNVGDSAAAAE